MDRGRLAMDNEIQTIVNAERRRIAEAQNRLELRLARARNAAPRIARDLARIDPNVREVWLFGSVATGRVRTAEFDIDLAVRGGDIVSLLAKLAETDFKVDLIDLDSVSEKFGEMVTRRGEQVYDARR